MENQELKVFLSIIEHGGFQKAAKQLRLTQPAVSLSLANLERKLNELLIIRSTPLKLTPIGEELIKHARYVLDSESDFHDKLNKIKKGYLQNLTIAVDHIAASYYCPKLIKSFNKILPEANIKVIRMPSREIIQAIKNEKYLLGLGPFQKKMENLETKKLYTEESFLVTGKKNKYLKYYKHDPLHFLKENVLLASYIDDPGNRPSKIKIRDYFKNTWEINDINLQMNLIKEGIGVTFVGKSYLNMNKYNKDIQVLDKVSFGRITKQYGYYFLKSNKNNEIIKAVINAI